MYLETLSLILFNLFYPLYIFVSYKLNLIKKETYYKGIKYIIKKNGPVFIKFTQLLLIKKEHLIKYNKKYFDEDLILILSGLENDIYKSDKKIYSKFNNKLYNIKNSYSIDSGSVAYIYEVYYDKNICILKTVHENIKKKLKNHIKILKIFLYLFSFNSNYFEIINVIKVDNFENLLVNQADMNLESNNLKKFYEIFSSYDIVHIPKYYENDEYNLIMSKVDGIKLYDFLKINPESKLEVIYLIYSCIHKMVSNKILHGDFHQGNILFFKIDNNVNISILDFGLVFILNNRQSEIILDYLESFKRIHLINLINTFGNKLIETDFKTTKKESDITYITNLILKYKLNFPIEILNLISTIDFIKNLCENMKTDKNLLLDNLFDYMIDKEFI